MYDDLEAAPDQQALARVQDLIAELEDAPDEPTAAVARELLEIVLEAHAGALARLLEIIGRTPGGENILADMGQDEKVRAIMLLHGLHPEDSATRVRSALERLRPLLARQGVALANLDFAGNGVRIVLRCEARANLPPAEAVQRQIEEAIFDAAPDVAGIAVEGLPVSSPVLALDQLQRQAPRASSA